MSSEKNNNKTKEPAFLYKDKDLTVYSNINEAADAEMRYTANQKPIERIRETVQLILRVFPLDEKKINANTIYFDKV